ncbi:MAG: hypothetical protein M0C28_21690 [Candidatus Moduliflexus flocculans]|nr:hypothetical protein [Candidatus Moduliflexus flocculans]
MDEGAFRETLAAEIGRGCLISYGKATPDGPIPYELNASWFDAVADPALPEDLRIRAHLASHAIAASLDGMPAVYIHSILGTPNWTEGPVLRGYNRAINRRVLDLKDVESAPGGTRSRSSRCLAAFRSLYGHRSLNPHWPREHRPGCSPGTAPCSPSSGAGRENASSAPSTSVPGPPGSSPGKTWAPRESHRDPSSGAEVSSSGAPAAWTHLRRPTAWPGFPWVRLGQPSGFLRYFLESTTRSPGRAYERP